MEPIAIIGIGCRFPRAQGPAEFWKLLHDGTDAISEVPPERWDITAFYNADPDAPGKMNTRWGGFLQNVDEFDPGFFRISPREAIRMDPQHRLLLEVAAEALEDAGLVPEKLAGSRTGVFVGISSYDYGSFQLGNPWLSDSHAGTGSALSIAANRLSYVFDFRGPSLAVDTACSSSLVAVHLACNSLWHEEATLALAGGVNVILSPTVTINFTKAGFMAPDGRCKAFDSRANGYVRGEGAGLVILKPLARAIADGDPIYAVIRGSAVNQDGRSNGITAPSRWAQEAVIRDAYYAAGVSPGRVSFVETHGSGTALGDPIEANALGAVLAGDRSPVQPCAIGSVKTNIGHLEAAAGIAGLIKTTLSLKHRLIPPSLHFREPNPRINFRELHLRVQEHLGEWPSNFGARVAGVSAFGFGGTNAHIVLEEAPEQGLDDSSSAHRVLVKEHRAQLVPISARSFGALKDLAGAYVSWLADDASSHEPPPRIEDIAYTNGLRRGHHEFRLSVVAKSGTELRERLKEYADSGWSTGISYGRKIAGHPPKIVYVFSGQGSQWQGMAQNLLRAEPVFREAIEECDAALHPYVKWSLLEGLAGKDDQKLLDLNRIDVIQPALFAVQAALGALWRSWGVEPHAVVGHSMGEVAAAYIAGALSLDMAAQIICERSRLMRHMSGSGAMAVVELPFESAQRLVGPYEGRLSVAASNSPQSSVLSGDPVVLHELLILLGHRDIFCRQVKVDVAAHSPQMDLLREELLQTLSGLTPLDSSVPFYSTVTGQLIDGKNLNAEYWMQNLREPVLFTQAVQWIIKDEHNVFLEISPHPILTVALMQGLQHLGRNGTVLPTLKRDEEEQTILSSLGVLYTLGCAIDWNKVPDSSGRCIPLPMYPWQHERFWLEDNVISSTKRIIANHQQPNNVGHHPLLGPHIEVSSHPGSHIWETNVSIDAIPYLALYDAKEPRDLPAAVYLEMILAAADTLLEDGFLKLENVRFEKAFALGQAERSLQLAVTPDETDLLSFCFSSAHHDHRPRVSWEVNAKGQLGSRGNVLDRQLVALKEVRARCRQKITSIEYYRKLEESGLRYNIDFQCIKIVLCGQGEVLANLRLSAELCKDIKRYCMHPVLLDTCFQVLWATSTEVASTRKNGEIYVPIEIQSLTVFDMCQDMEYWCQAVISKRIQSDEEIIEGNVYLVDQNGKIIMEALGVRLKCMKAEQQDPLSGSLYEVQWEPKKLRGPSEKPTGHWIIFKDSNGIAEQVQGLLNARGHSCSMVTPGSSFTMPQPDFYQINPNSVEDYEHLIRSVIDVGHDECLGILHLWSLRIPASDTDFSWLELGQEIGCESVLSLVQAITNSGWQKPPCLCIITAGVHSLDTKPKFSSVVQAPVWGFVRSLNHEHPELNCKLVDLGDQADSAEIQALSEEVLIDDREQQVALRNNRRLVSRMIPSRLALQSKFDDITFRFDHVYVITGGLGDLGMAVAKWMVDRGAQYLILLGRGRPSQVAEKAIEAMKGVGAKVSVLQLDITDWGQLALLNERLHELALPVAGVIHAAGILDDHLVKDMSIRDLRRAMAPKVRGAWNLHQITVGQPLDFFILYSSAAGVLGSPGQANYAAGCSFLDAFAYFRKSQNLPAISIDWGPWSQIGLASQEKRSEKLMVRGFDPIAPQQGLSILNQLIQQDLIQICALHLDLQQWSKVDSKAADSPFYTHLAEVAKSRNMQQDESRYVKAQSFVLPSGPGRLSTLRSHITEQSAQILQLSSSRLDINATFQDLGFDSLMGLELNHRLETTLGLTLPATLIWTYPTIGELAEVLIQKLDNPLPSANQTQLQIKEQSEGQDASHLLDELTEDDLVSLLAEELKAMNKKGQDE